jgi:hypothetical protein
MILAKRPSVDALVPEKDDLNEVHPSYDLVPQDAQLSLDASGRYFLGKGILEFGTVVVVERDKFFFFRKSLNLSIFSIVGTVITIVALLRSKPLWLQLLVGVFVALAYFYLALSVERSKVR